jgi:hypothetical protein
LYRLSLPASGAVSQLTVNGAGVTVKAGQILRLVHPITLQSEEVTVLSDRVGDTVFVVTKTLQNSYPTGAYVYVSAQSQQAGIIVGENAVRIYAEGQSLGRLAQPIDGTVTSIDAHLYTKLVRGMEFLVVNEQTGRTYAFTVNQDTAGPGVVTFDVESQVATARVGDYLVGDNSFQQSQITVSQGEIVLKVDSNNRVALVRLSADNDSGSEIDISAEQVKINGIVFTEGSDPIYTPGDIATFDYSAGVSGWKIDGDGSAEFNDVVVRGSLLGGSGALRYELTPSGGVVLGVSGSYNSTLTADSLVLDTSASVDANTPQVTLKGDDVSARYGNMRFRWLATDANNATLQLLDGGDPKISLSNNGSATLKGALGAPLVTITSTSATPYTVLASDTHIAVDNGASPFTVNLPAGTAGRKVTIFDSVGTASLGTITINRAGSNTINGATSTTLTTNYQSVTLLFTAGNWVII